MDLRIVNLGNGFVEVTGSVARKMLNNIFFLLSLLYDSGNCLLFDDEKGESRGFRIHRDYYEELIIGHLPRKIAENQKNTIHAVFQKPVGEGYHIWNLGTQRKKSGADLEPESPQTIPRSKSDEGPFGLPTYRVIEDPNG